MSVYNRTITPEPQPRNTADMVLRWSALTIIVVAALVAWSNHFDSTFHLDDVNIIVNNPAVHSVSNLSGFFTNPKIYDGLPRYSAYRPLLYTSFAFDYVGGEGDPHVFQFDTFFWFTAQLAFTYLLFRLLTGGNHYLALFATTLYGLHPATADTLDYVLQRGEVFAGLGITAGLVLWIVWPRRMPSELDLTMLVKSVPEDFGDLMVRRAAHFVSAVYNRIVKAGFPLYIVPVLIALLANPASAVFALILLVYVKLYEPEAPQLRRLIPAAALCAFYWLFQAVLTAHSGIPSRVPPFAWWYTQPWVAMRYLGAFFAPGRLTADSNLQPLAHFWSPLALVGYAGVAALVRIAVIAGRRTKWRSVSFGVWWFLIALIPSAVIPQQAVEADPRMYVPFAGLALAAMSIVFLGFERLRDLPRFGPSIRVAGPVLAGAILPFLVWATWERNQVWLSEESLWEDVVTKNPGNGRGLMNYGLILMSGYEPDLGAEYIHRAAALLPRDAPLEVHLAQMAASAGRNTEAEDHYRRAIAFDPSYSTAYSDYGRWLLSRQRTAEAFDNATKAAKLSSGDLVARHTLMDIYADRSDWPDLLRIANEALQLDPNDVDGQRALRVAQTGINEVRESEKTAKSKRTAESYLSLSVVYFRNGRYQDSIAAAREALKIHPDLAEAYVNIATANHVQGRDDDAIVALREALRIKPDLQVAKNNLAYELAQKSGVAKQ